MKIKLSEKRIIAPWKTRIIALMQTKFVDGITAADVIKAYPAAPKKYVELAIKELTDEDIAEKVE